jgi:Uma2 family endonuclease
MAEPAISPMTLDEFLRWDDGTDTYYELIGGSPRAMPPSLEAQRILTTRLATRIDATLADRRPANAQVSAGVVPPHLADTFFVADVAATSAAIEPSRQAIEHPFLIIEILSPSTERHDRRVKLPAYRQIETVQEIVLIASDEIYAELHQRTRQQWVTEILHGGNAMLRLKSAGMEVPLGDLYDGIALGDDEG